MDQILCQDCFNKIFISSVKNMMRTYCLVNEKEWDEGVNLLLFAVRTPAYDTVRPLAYKDASVFLLCFSIGDPGSLSNTTSRWNPEIRYHCAEVPVILCGCQSDLRSDMGIASALAKDKQHPVTSEQALVVSRQVGAATYVETSSKQTGRSSQDAFEVAALAALGKLNKTHSTNPRPSANYKSKIDIKEEFHDRGKNCVAM
ncbi:ras-like GTP-binding protein rhoA [Limulus polyphemus]|uniref:Ras-like GTP-binding protein rhoA n=1 Tax=Limulus polyphemus TaxID=6850 RepID=A0ABM1SCW7_LIMPO|nr:ras-like GTP-binding protein rhoA [Limulus polyphemus]